MKRLILAGVITFLFSASTVQAQDFCKGDFNYNGSVGAEDVTTFLDHFGRNAFTNSCPPDGPSPVAKTGQNNSYVHGSDGDLQRGVEWPVPRFTDNGNGTVTDNLTGLIWLKNANCYGLIGWQRALGDCNKLANGQCGLTDGSSAGDWRIPNYKELFSLVDAQNVNPALPSGHPFINVNFVGYWSSTIAVLYGDEAFLVSMSSGAVYEMLKFQGQCVWPVRGGR